MTAVVDVGELAALAGVSRQAVEKAVGHLARQPDRLWRGCRLKVETKRGRGGRGGVSYLIRVDNLPEPLQAAWKARGRPVQLALPLRLDDAATAERRERMLIIEPIVAHPERSPERRAALRAAIGTTIIRNGRREPLSETTLRRWMKDLAEGGEAALQRKARKERNTVRQDVSQRWDAAAAELPAAVRAEIADKLTVFLFSRWGEGCPFGVVKRLGEERLAKLTREAGCSLSAPELARACILPKHVVERRRADGHRVFTRRRDAKGHDDATPRVRQTSAGQPPMFRVLGDGHHVDVLVPRGDGTFATPKAIAWFDASTHRLRIDLVLCEAGTGLRNADLIQSYIEMTQDPHWGVSQTLHLDNGSEYNFADMLGDPMALATLGCTVKPLTRARAYNPAAKGLLEGALRILEGMLKPMLGSIPGNRILTRSANLGKAPAPFDGTFEEFAKAFAGVLAFYNSQVQTRGDIKGMSPNGAYAKAVREGWQRLDVDGDALRTAFSVKETRTVMRGKISVGGELFYCPELFPHNGQKVMIQRPKYLRWDGIPVFDIRGRYLAVAHLDEAHERGSPSGPIESARRRKAAYDASAALVREADDEKAIALMQETAGAEPALPRPKSAGRIIVSDDAETMGRQLRETKHEAGVRSSQGRQDAQRARLAIHQKLKAERKS